MKIVDHMLVITLGKSWYTRYVSEYAHNGVPYDVTESGMLQEPIRDNEITFTVEAGGDLPLAQAKAHGVIADIANEPSMSFPFHVMFPIFRKKNTFRVVNFRVLLPQIILWCLSFSKNM